MLRSSTFPRPAISKFRNVYEQIVYELGRMALLWRSRDIADLVRYTDARRHRRPIEGIREIALWSGPIPQLGCCKRLLYKNSYMFQPSGESR
jgi:hypothetical protein